MDAAVFLEQAGIEHRRVIAAQHHGHSGGEQPGQRMVGQRRNHAGGNVAGRADLQGDPGLAQPVEQPRVAGRGDAVTDPLRAKLVDGGPDLPGADALAGMRHAVQPGGPGGGELVAEIGPADPCLHSAKAEPDQRGGRVAQRRLESLPGSVPPVESRDVIHPGQLHAAGPGGGRPGIERPGELACADAGPDVRDRGDRHLGIERPLRDHVPGQARDERDQVLRIPHQIADQLVDIEEVGEVLEPVERAQLVNVGRNAAVRMTRRQGGDRGRRGRADEMDVQVCLGHRDEPVVIAAEGRRLDRGVFHPAPP